jgi:hypothetical protein
MKNLTKNKLTGINLGVLATLAPLLIVASNHLPAKYLWAAPLLLQLGNWLLQNKALKSQNPNLASRKALKLALDIARERHKDAELFSQNLFRQGLTELTPAQMSSLINHLKKTRLVQGATLEEAVDALKGSEKSNE